VITSALPFSTSTMAMRLPTFSRVTSLKMFGAGPVEVDVHGGLVGALVEAGLRIADAVAGQRDLAPHQELLAVALGEDVVADRHAAASALRARPGSSLTMRISSDAVRPRMSFARAVSCTPGSCTTTRSAPCCWMIGSATPSSLTRLRRIWMFCATAFSWTFFSASA
jgi:hypothetical protein